MNLRVIPILPSMLVQGGQHVQIERLPRSRGVFYTVEN
jgi:hypothetical protein